MEKTRNDLTVSELRKKFDEKTSNQGNENEKSLKIIQDQLNEKHKSNVHDKNKKLVKIFGSILLAVNHHDSELIDRLGGGSLSSIDTDGETIAFIMGYSESVQGHGVRYLCEYGVYHNGNLISSGPITYRGAYASEEDHWERCYTTIKILDIDGESVSFGVSSNKQLLLKELNGPSMKTIDIINLAEEKRVIEKNKLLADVLEGKRKDNLEKYEKLISNNTSGELASVKDPFVTDDYAIFPVIYYDRQYDASDTRYEFYIVGKNHPKPIIIKKGYFNYQPNKSTRFFRNEAKVNLKKSSNDLVKVDIEYRHTGMNHGYKLGEETFDIMINKFDEKLEL